MRKIIIEMNPTLITKFVKSDFFQSLEYIEGKALLTFDIERGIKIGICDIKMKDSYTRKDFKAPKGFDILNVLREEGNKSTCLVKIEYRKNLMKILKLFNVNRIIYDLPFIISEEKIVFAFIADSEALKKLLTIIKPLGLVRNISFQKITSPEYGALSCLTDRQSQIILAAKKHGYYEYPRKITPEELSQRLGISKATTIEHLRKAENRIISYITTGY
ncbi:MAG: helix-turn-helix domain-containing protein [Theionarchaea archaeon]|nr:helix-turn-helix domain-containing protein [Theionarchaea archaeon]